MKLANQEAQRFNHEYIGTEHILIGLVQERTGVAASILKKLGVDLRKIRLEVEKIVQHGPAGERVSMDRLPYTPRAKTAIEYAVDEAHKLGNGTIGAEHLLLGLLREKEGVAFTVFENLGLNPDEVRNEVIRRLSPS